MPYFRLYTFKGPPHLPTVITNYTDHAVWFNGDPQSGLLLPSGCELPFRSGIEEFFLMVEPPLEEKVDVTSETFLWNGTYHVNISIVNKMVTTKPTLICECGKEKHNFFRHSDWCPVKD